MVEDGAEAAMRRACDFILAGDYMSAMADLTPDAAAEALALVAGMTAIALPTAYTIEDRQALGGDERFRVRFTSGEQEMRAWAVWRQIEGEWKIVSLGFEG